MKKIILLFLSACFALLSWAKPLDLTRPELVVPDDALPCVRFAAEELQEHLELITGYKPEIFTESRRSQGSFTATVWLGDCRHARETGLSANELKNFEFIIKSQDGELFLLGRDKAGNMTKTARYGALTVSSGTLFAVYDFLDRDLGVYHIWPGKLGTVVKARKVLQLESVKERRGGHWSRSSLFWSGDYFAGRAPFYSNTAHEFLAVQRQWLWRQKFCVVSDGVFSGHRFKSYWKRFHRTHPEYFAMLPDGKRRLLDGDIRGTRVTMCVSNPDLARQAAEDYRQVFLNKKLAPEVRNALNAGENDAPGMCTCRSCRAWDDPEDKRFDIHPYWMGKVIPSMAQRFPLLDTIDGGSSASNSPSLSDRYCRFYLALQQQARQINPDVKVCGFAYANYAAPPRTVKLNDGIIITVVNWSYFPFTNERILQSMSDWEKWRDTGAQLALRPNSTNCGHNMPIFYGRKLAKLFLHAYNNGAVAVSYDSLIGQWGAQSASYYCLGRLNARPDLTVEQVLDEYFSAFGAAADEIREFVAFLEQNSERVTVDEMWAHARKLQMNRLPNHKNWLQAADAVFTSEFFAAGKRILDRAEKKAANDPTALARVRYLQSGFEHSRRTFEVLKLSRGSDRVAFVKAQQELLEYRQQIAGELSADLPYLYVREKSGSRWYAERDMNLLKKK
ncbi:MAG: DUF4838 domain-containing protein [Lentisphaerae bacterium]|nr:DUF4838 domain-containing protein [Lentisphaerota bacterium]